MRIRVVLALVVATLSTMVLASNPPTPTQAHHSNNGHVANLWPLELEGLPGHYGNQVEMNGRTTNALRIPTHYVSGNVLWIQQWAYAVQSWNSGMFPTTGFDVFEFGSDLTGYIDFQATNPSLCPFGSHGCVRYWNPTIPSGTVSMWSANPPFATGNHRKSDIMHELGHVLMNANEHYARAETGSTGEYNCLSIMGHSSTEGGFYSCGTVIHSVLPHDIDDYKDVYGVEDTQDAVYVTPGFGQLVHYFESGYLGGNGRAVHQEYDNVIDRSTVGLSGNPADYVYYYSASRRVDNSDNTTPESQAVSPLPSAGSEWCFKIHGHSYAVAAGSPGEWGPFSKRYCMAVSGPATGVLVTSDRNGNANFRVWNFSGAALANVQLRTDPAPGTLTCGPWAIADGAQSPPCSVNILGPGYLTLWYNNAWVPQDTIGYDE